MLKGPYHSDIELSLVFMTTRILDLNIVDTVGIRMEPLVHVPNIKYGNSLINKGSTHQDLSDPHLEEAVYLPGQRLTHN